MKIRIFTAAAAALLVASGAQASVVVADLSTAQSKSATATSMAMTQQATGKAAEKAAKRAAKADKRASKQAAKAAKRLAKQCRKERKLLAKKGVALSSACMPASTAVADVKVSTPAGTGGGGALGQTGTPTGQGTQGNGVGYGVGYTGNAGTSGNNVVITLPRNAYQPTNDPAPVMVAMNGEPIEVPEPATLSLLGLGLLGLGAAGRRKRR